MAKLDPYLLGLAGEYRVCSELNKRGIFATVTYGNRKSVDVYAISDRRQRALKIEVKTSQRSGFVTGISQKGLDKDPAAADFWVLFQLSALPDGTFSERFFVLTHSEICGIQRRRNRRYAIRYRRQHGAQPDLSRGVDNVRVKDVEKFEGGWERIGACLEPQPVGRSRARSSGTTVADVRAALEERLRAAAARGEKTVVVRAGDLHRSLGGVERMPTVCLGMRKVATARDKVLAAPPKGQGASLTIAYRLPRD